MKPTCLHQRFALALSFTLLVRIAPGFTAAPTDDAVWQDAQDSGCKYLHMGYESGSERVLQLMDTATTTEIRKVSTNGTACSTSPLNG